MSENLYNKQIFDCIVSNINNVHEYEKKMKKLQYSKKDDSKDLKIVEDIKLTADCKKLQKQMRKHMESKQRIDAFKKQLKNNTEYILNTDNIEDFKKPWLKLTNDQRANRITEYIKTLDIDKDKKRKLRLLLIQGITNKLLERNSIKYDDENACILSIPSVQFNHGTDNYYFI